jgi:hypothetical protein
MLGTGSGIRSIRPPTFANGSVAKSIAAGLPLSGVLGTRFNEVCLKATLDRPNETIEVGHSQALERSLEQQVVIHSENFEGPAVVGACRPCGKAQHGLEIRIVRAECADDFGANGFVQRTGIIGR